MLKNHKKKILELEEKATEQQKKLRDDIQEIHQEQLQSVKSKLKEEKEKAVDLEREKAEKKI